MIDTFKNTVLAGLGAASVSKERVREALDVLVAQGKITAAEAKAAAERIAAEGKKDFDVASAKVATRVKELVAYTDGEHVRKIRDLEARVAALEARTVKKKAKAS